MDEFNIKAKKVEVGNMKGGWESHFKEGTIFLSGAEMDFPTAPVIRERLVEVASNGLYGFTLADSRYLDSICNWMKKVREINIQKEDIVPTMGTIFGLNTAIRAFSEIGDEIIIQSPSYYRFDVAVKNNLREIIYNPMKCMNGVYELDFEDLEKKMSSPKAKMMILCHPHNPTGKVFTIDELTRISILAKQYQILVYVDEIFGEMQYGSNISYAHISQDNCIISTSLGKTFNFTGVNHANLIIQDQHIREIYLKQRKIDHFGSLDPFFYNALVAAYTDQGYSWVKQVKEYIYEQYIYIQEHLKDTEIIISPLEGGFILWLDFSVLGLKDEQLEKELLEKVELVGDPGYEYGIDYGSYIRINLGTSHQNIVRMVDNIKRLVDQY